VIVERELETRAAVGDAEQGMRSGKRQHLRRRTVGQSEPEQLVGRRSAPRERDEEPVRAGNDRDQTRRRLHEHPGNDGPSDRHDGRCAVPAGLAAVEHARDALPGTPA
jgi:hypothetical protein